MDQDLAIVAPALHAAAGARAPAWWRRRPLCWRGIYEPLHPGMGVPARLLRGGIGWRAGRLVRGHCAVPAAAGIAHPHTAIIPEQKDRLGEALGEFVERNFLSPEVVAAKLADIDLRGCAGRMADRSNPLRTPLRGGLTGCCRGCWTRSARSPCVTSFREKLESALRRVELAPLAAELLDTLTAQDRHQGLDRRAGAAGGALLARCGAGHPRARARQDRLAVAEAGDRREDRRSSDRGRGGGSGRDRPRSCRTPGGNASLSWCASTSARCAIRTNIDSARSGSSRRCCAYPGLSQYLGAVWDEVRARVRDDAARDDSQDPRQRGGDAGLARGAGCAPGCRRAGRAQRLDAHCPDRSGAHATQRGGAHSSPIRCGAGMRPPSPTRSSARLVATCSTSGSTVR